MHGWWGGFTLLAWFLCGCVELLVPGSPSLWVERSLSLHDSGVEPRLAGDALVYLDGMKRAVRREGTAERRVQLAGHPCLVPGARPSLFGVDPMGMQAIVWGESGGVTGDFIHVVGVRTTVDCLLDFKAGTAHVLSDALPQVSRSMLTGSFVLGAGRLYHWTAASRIYVTELSTGHSAGLTERSDSLYCDVSEHGSVALVACIYRQDARRGSVLFKRMDLSSVPPRSLDSFTLAVDLPLQIHPPVMARDGSRLLYFGETYDTSEYAPLDAARENVVVAIDLHRRSLSFVHALRQRGLIHRVATTTDGGLTLIGEWQDVWGQRSRIRILARNGEDRGTWPIEGHLKAILPLQQGHLCWLVVDDTAYLIRLPAQEVTRPSGLAAGHSSF